MASHPLCSCRSSTVLVHLIGVLLFLSFALSNAQQSLRFSSAANRKLRGKLPFAQRSGKSLAIDTTSSIDGGERRRLGIAVKPAFLSSPTRYEDQENVRSQILAWMMKATKEYQRLGIDDREKDVDLELDDNILGDKKTFNTGLKTFTPRDGLPAVQALSEDKVDWEDVLKTGNLESIQDSQVPNSLKPFVKAMAVVMRDTWGQAAGFYWDSNAPGPSSNEDGIFDNYESIGYLWLVGHKESTDDMDWIVIQFKLSAHLNTAIFASWDVSSIQARASSMSLPFPGNDHEKTSDLYSLWQPSETLARVFDIKVDRSHKFKNFVEVPENDSMKSLAKNVEDLVTEESSFGHSSVETVVAVSMKLKMAGYRIERKKMGDKKLTQVLPSYVREIAPGAHEWEWDTGAYNANHMNNLPRGSFRGYQWFMKGDQKVLSWFFLKKVMGVWTYTITFIDESEYDPYPDPYPDP